MPWIVGVVIALGLVGFVCGFVGLWIAFFAFRFRFNNWMAVRAFALSASLGLLVPFFDHDDRWPRALLLLALCACVGGFLAGIRWPAKRKI